MKLKTKESFFERLQRFEVIGHKGLTLEDREIDFNLIQPTRMHRGMNEYEIAIAGLQPFHRTRTAMGRTIVNDQENTPCCSIGWLTHHVVNKAIKRNDAASAFAPAKQFGAMDIKGRYVGPSAATRVFMFHFHRRIRLDRIGSMTTTARLDAGFLIGRQNKLIVPKGMPIPHPFIEIQDSPGFLGKVRITGKYPGTIPPGTNGILMKPSPYSAVTDGGCESRSSNLPAKIGNTPSRKRHLMDCGQFTGQCLNLNDDLPGEKSGGVPDGVVLQAQGGVLQRNVFATC